MFDSRSQIPTPDVILTMSKEDVSALVQTMVFDGELSRFVKALNNDILNGPEEAQTIASRCLEHMGFVV